MALRDAPEFDVDQYRSPPEFGGSALPLTGPNPIVAILLIAMCVVAAVRLDNEGVLGTIAIVNALAHFVCGFGWTIQSADSLPKHKAKLLAIMVWLATILLGVVLLIASFFL